MYNEILCNPTTRYMCVRVCVCVSERDKEVTNDNDDILLFKKNVYQKNLNMDFTSVTHTEQFKVNHTPEGKIQN